MVQQLKQVLAQKPKKALKLLQKMLKILQKLNLKKNNKKQQKKQQQKPNLLFHKKKLKNQK